MHDGSMVLVQSGLSGDVCYDMLVHCVPRAWSIRAGGAEHVT